MTLPLFPHSLLPIVFHRVYPFLLVLLSWFVVPLMAAQTETTPSDRYRQAKVDSVFRKWDNPTSPGCELGIIRNGEFVYLHGYGMADIDRRIPITSTTVFNIASLSKQFTAASLVLLSQQGKLSLDDDVRKYIPELPDYGKPITIRKLLNHTSGIRDYVQMMFLAGSRYGTLTKNADALKMIVRQKALNFTPGDEWLYSNSGYVLASLIVERVSGESLGAFERENIFEPLGMNNTSVVNDHNLVIAQRALGYGPGLKGSFQEMVTNWENTGDGGVHSTVGDLLRWDRNFYDPKLGGKGMIEQLVTPGRLNDGTVLQYALGLGVREYKGLKVVNHEGEWAGYRAEFMRFPDQHFSIIILCNLSTMVPLQLAERVADICLAGEMRKTQQERGDTSSAEKTVRYSIDELSRYGGLYRSPADELVRGVVVKDGKLLYVRGANNVTELVPLGNDRFLMKGIPVETNVIFTRSSPGSVSGMQIVTKGTKPIIFEAFISVVPSPELLGHYAGVYRSDELGVDYRVFVRDSSLFMHTTYPDDDHLVPTVPDVFKVEDAGVVRFSRSDGHSVVGFSFTFGKVRNIKFVRTH